MKSYYACLDTAYVKYVPQPLQHLSVSNKANKLAGEVTFYTMEDMGSLASQGAMRAKLEERPAVDGIICFSMQQFFYSGKLNLKLLSNVLDSGYEIHFSKEDISIPTRESLDHLFPMLYSSQRLWERDGSRDFWRPIWDQLDDAGFLTAELGGQTD